MSPFRVKNPSHPGNSPQYSKCSLVNRDMAITLSVLTMSKLEALMDSYPHREWCGYLQGFEVKNGYWIRDILIPPHEASEGGYCLAEPFNQPKDCVGFLHSHHCMGAFHSGQDAVTVDVNYKISITIAKRIGSSSIEFSPIVNQETPCHHKFRALATVFVSRKLEQLPTGWLEQARANIDKPHLPKPVLQLQAIQIPTVRQLPDISNLAILKPYTVDKQGNLRDKHGHYSGKNKQIHNPIDGHIYYMDTQGGYFTQEELDYLLRNNDE